MQSPFFHAHAYTSIETRGLNDIERCWHCNLQYAFEEQFRQYYLRTPLQRGRFEEVYHDHADLLKKTGNTETGKKAWLRISNTKVQTA